MTFGTVSPGIAALYFIGFLGALQALVIGVLVGTIAAPRTRWFGFLVGLLGLAMGLITLSHAPVGRSMPWLLPAELTVGFAAPSVFYVWAELTLRGGRRPRPVDRLHLLAPVAWVGIAALLLLRGEHLPGSAVELMVLYQITYTAWIAWRVFVRGPGPAARDEEVRLLRITVGFFAAIHVAQILRMVVEGPALRPIVPLTSAVAVFVLTGLAVRQSRLFSSPEARRQARYGASSLGEVRAGQGEEKLRRALEEERVYLRPDLTLPELADELGLPRGHLSQIVNERFGCNFSELLARHRVGCAEAILADPECEHLTVESIGFRAGFNSRSAFYDAFKRTTGVTPAAYRSRHLAAD